MPHSLVAKLSGLKHKGFITEAEYDRLRKGLNSLKVDEMYGLEMEQADEFIPRSVVEDIRADMQKKKLMYSHPHEIAKNVYREAMNDAIELLDKHISGKE